MLAAFRRNTSRDDRLTVDVDAALRHLGELHRSGRAVIATLDVAGALRTVQPAPLEQREVEWEIRDERADQVLVSGTAAEVDLGNARRVAMALAHRLGRRLRLTYTAEITFTTTTSKEA